MSDLKKEKEEQKLATGAELVVDCLIKQGVKYIFGIPGAKIDAVYDVLKDRGPELIVCRHEQNAAFMAAAIGRITCKPGVCLVTSGPGASNLATGIVTANVENDPIVALVGAVPRADRLKRTHQSMDNAALFQPISKFSAEVVDPKNVAEVVTNAFRAAESTSAGASVVSFPQDVLVSKTTVNALGPLESPKLGTASEEAIDKAVEAIKNAKMPVILAGMRANRFSVVSSVRSLLRKIAFPVVETFQAAGLIPRDMEERFFGRIGLFRNQPGDLVLEKADVVVTIGYDSVEYDPKFWNNVGARTIIHLDEVRADIDHFYQPSIELVGDIPSTVQRIKDKLTNLNMTQDSLSYLEVMRHRLDARDEPPKETNGNLVHPLSLIHTLRHLVSDETTITCDVGSHYIWMARHFRSYEPKTLLFSNGMQTLGVALPWAMAASLVKDHAKTISMSGDGGFLFSAMELETAVRLKLPIVHIVWRDGTYDMVAFQQQMKYKRTSGINFGKIDIVKYAEAFGAKGLRVNKPEELESVLKEGLAYNDGPVIIDVPVDYSDNIALGKSLIPNQLN
ncbi:acetolactate synthase AlsS [Sporolactobacillus nakayamae]|uniref:Acetolactate synthase, large subunit n=1 Tax=Sporolactobacillus nakayamae TaxID=269670 RepID=A0A1I2SQM7_9BACL|nr:acetolactate synthase AlsS [Sporolactobacillus nakayamae]SFG53257.1 acetolactate synthase, large subunit [Sporolactobacillus nakayamae]